MRAAKIDARVSAGVQAILGDYLLEQRHIIERLAHGAPPRDRAALVIK